MYYTNNNLQDYDQDILNSITSLLQYYTSKHVKTLVVRLDLKFPNDYPLVSSNEYISSFIAKLVKKYSRQGLGPYYLWVMEKNSSSHPHYHVVLLLNANKVRSFAHVFMNAEELWSTTLGCDTKGCVHYCLGNDQFGNKDFYNGKILFRTSDDFAEDYNSVADQLSYLAKTYSKNYNQDGLRNYGMSRLKEN